VFDKIIIQFLSIRQSVRESVHMNDYLPFRKSISDNDKELIIYGADNFSVVLLTENMDQIFHLEESLKEMGISWIE